jgi:hypothetical protein
MTGSIRRLSAIALFLVPLQVWGAPSIHANSASQSTANSKAAHGLQPDGPRRGNVTNPYIKTYCEGTGSSNNGVDCPCGNTVPSGTITGCTNRTGHGASLIPSGNASISNDTFVLTASGTADFVPAFFIAGAVNAGQVVFGNGTRCIGGPFVRLLKVDHSAGSYTLPAPNTPPISVQMNLSPGDTTFFQVLYRDLGGPCGGSVNSTNAVMVIWGN